MRSRNIKPGFFKNEILGECSPLARLLFAGLWCMADREGRLECRPKRIKVEILPYDDSDVEQLLDCLVKNNFIQLYSIDSQEYIAIKAWDKHQSPHIKEAKSTIPPPNKHQTGTRQTPDKHQTSTEVAALIPDSLNLIPDSNTPLTPQGGNPAKNDYPEAFDLWWKLYPKKVGKDAAFKSWKKAVKNNGAKTGDLITAIRNQITVNHFVGSNGENFIPLPTTWLNQGRWKDEVGSATVVTPKPFERKYGDE